MAWRRAAVSDFGLALVPHQSWSSQPTLVQNCASDSGGSRPRRSAVMAGPISLVWRPKSAQPLPECNASRAFGLEYARTVPSKSQSWFLRLAAAQQMDRVEVESLKDC